MNAAMTIAGFADYGYAELKRVYQRHFREAFAESTAIHVVVVGLYLLGAWALQEPARVYNPRIIRYADLGPPPSLVTQTGAPQIQVAQANARPTVGIPQPVPDAEVSPEATIATQVEMSQITSVVGGEGLGEGSVIQVEQPAATATQELVVDEGRLPEATEFVPVEEEPIPLVMPEPIYPEIARRAGIEGQALVHVLVDRMGKVRDVKIMRGPEIFHEAAKEAAWKSVWRPAIQNHKPVAVWVAIPLRFTLRD